MQEKNQKKILLYSIKNGISGITRPSMGVGWPILQLNLSTFFLKEHFLLVLYHKKILKRQLHQYFLLYNYHKYRDDKHKKYRELHGSERKLRFVKVVVIRLGGKVYSFRPTFGSRRYRALAGQTLGDGRGCA